MWGRLWPYRFGERREEEAGGETEDGPEESHQVDRRVENEVRPWENVVWCHRTVAGYWSVLTKCLLIVLCCPLCRPLYYNWEGTLHSAQGLVQSFALFTVVFSGCEVLQRPPQGKMHNYNCVVFVFFSLLIETLVNALALEFSREDLKHFPLFREVMLCCWCWYMLSIYIKWFCLN